MPKFCPKCGTPVIPQEALFCCRCGSELPRDIPKKNERDICPQCGIEKKTDSRFCYKCGVSFGNSQDSSPSPTKDKIKTRIKTDKNHRIPAILGIIIFLIGVCVVITGVYFFLPSSGFLTATQSAPSGSSPPGSVTITKNMSAMALTASDLPAGWKSGTPIVTDTIYYNQFIKPESRTPDDLLLNITRFSTVNDAKNEFNSLKPRTTHENMEPVILGDEGFGYVNLNVATIVFRIHTLCVKIQYVNNHPGSSPSVEDAKKYALIVESRIKNQ